MKGDIVPFLYVKEHTDDSGIKENPREIAKYAYIALVNGWADCPNNNLWQEEFNSMYSEEEQDEYELIESLEKLEEWYSDTETKYQDKKGKKGNNLLGSRIEDAIKSEYSIQQKLEATKYWLETKEGIGDFKENMARNEMMAKYMMENSHISDIILDYNVGIKFITENLQRGTSESKNTSTAVLSDFQVLEFEHKLNKDGESDDDGLTDLEELTGARNGNVDSHVRWVDLTGMLDKVHKDKQAKGETTKDFDAAMKDLAEKNPGIFKYEGGKCLYRTYDYNSNPMLNDTDFDGMQDNIDSNKIDGTFKGSANNIGQVEYVSDYRYFFVDNNQYNDELSTMSLMLSNLANGGTAPMHGRQMSIGAYLDSENFSTPLHKTSFKISDTENISGDLYLAKKTIQVGANKKAIKRYKDVYGVFLGNFDTETNYKKLMANFDSEEVKTYYANIVNDIVSYINTNKPSTFNDYCYWVTGYSVAGGIASEVAAKLKEDGEVYCYTFGATNGSSSGTGAYAEIKNVINEDDLYPKIYNKDEGFSRSGALYNDSIFDNLQWEYKQLTGTKYYSDTKEFKDAVSPKLTNTIAKYIKDVKRDITIETWVSEWTNDLASYLYRPHQLLLKVVEFPHFIQLSISNKLTEVLNNSTDKIKKAHDIKSYYVLSKSLNGFDLNNEDVGWTEIEEVQMSDKYLSAEEKRLIQKFQSIDFDRFPCFQEYKYVGATVSNCSPMMFQNNEVWSNFRYGIAPKSNGTYKKIGDVACGAASMAMAVSTLSGKTITPVDIRNKWEQEGHTEYYSMNNGSDWNAIGVYSPDCFGIENVNYSDGKSVGTARYFTSKEDMIDYLIDGKVVIGIAHGKNNATWGNKHSKLTTEGHFVLIVGCNIEDIKKFKSENESEKIDIGDVGIYICDPNYSNQSNANKRICTTEFKLDFFDGHGDNKAGIDGYWAFDVGTSDNLISDDFDIPFDPYISYFYDTNPYGTTKKNKEYSQKIGSEYTWELPAEIE